MGRFSNLVKGVVVDVGGEKFTIKPLRMEEFGFLQEWSEFARQTKDKKLTKEEMQKQVDLMTELTYVSLHMADKTITLQDVKELPFSSVMKIIETIMTVNEFKE